MPDLTYITAHGNTGSLTHWAMPEIEPASSRILVGFITAEPREKLPLLPFFYGWEPSRYFSCNISFNFRWNFKCFHCRPHIINREIIDQKVKQIVQSYPARQERENSGPRSLQSLTVKCDTWTNRRYRFFLKSWNALAQIQAKESWILATCQSPAGAWGLIILKV